MKPLDLVCYTFLSRDLSLKGRIQEVGGVIYYESRHSGIVSAMVPRRELRRLLEDPQLIFAEAEQQVALPPPKVIEIFPSKSGRKRVRSTQQILPWNIKQVWRGSPYSRGGKGVRIGVLDTGIDLTHPDLSANIKGGINLVTPGKLPHDDNGHGTHIAGIIAARDNRLGVVGVAPSASLYAIKVLDKRGMGTLTSLIHGIDWGIDNGMHILNLSLSGGRTVSAGLARAIQAATNRGILVVVAAGNSGNASGSGDTVQVPGRLPSVVAVAALTRKNRRASFSSTGPSLDISAPGVNITSTYTGGRYAIFSGTSQAAPHVTGVAAIFKQQGLSAYAIRRRLILRAIPLGPTRLYGAGLVQSKRKQR
ncbi:S8 family peptidase [Salinithrix halophila]|uniref:S8 family peptidase n=1 Tax=Salinithrix halophila TaxID=1485204 RepID=A0ABV8JDC1_9BACL